MNNVINGIDARLKSLDQELKAHRAKQEMHGTYEKGHRLTEEALRDRWKELQSEIKSQSHDEKALHGKVDWLRDEIAKWVASTDLDFKA